MGWYKKVFEMGKYFGNGQQNKTVWILSHTFFWMVFQYLSWKTRKYKVLWMNQAWKVC